MKRARWPSCLRKTATPLSPMKKDVYIVNSCTVTNFGDQKSRKWLRRAKRENPGAVTVLTGCYPQAFPDEAAEIAEADVVTGSGNRHAILTDVQKVLNGEEERVIDIRPHEKGERFEELPMDKFAEHTRAFVKVEDGCNRRCAYCVIPRARGPVRSRDEASVLEELRRLTDAGYKEVVLTAISLPSYGTDSGTSLVELIEKAAEVPGIERIRLGSLDPDMLHDDDIRRKEALPAVPFKPAERLRQDAARHAPPLHDGPVRRYCSQAARGIRCGQRQLYHRCHRRFPRRDGG